MIRLTEPTEFQEKVYSVLRTIPRGRVMTYRQVAEAIGSKAYRAVGNACNKNPYWPEVPCHRVVHSDLSVGGFARGKAEKIRLLRSEGVVLRKGKISEKQVVSSLA